MISDKRSDPFTDNVSVVFTVSAVGMVLPKVLVLAVGDDGVEANGVVDVGAGLLDAVLV